MRRESSAACRLEPRESVESPRPAAVLCREAARVEVSSPTFCRLAERPSSSPFS